MNDSDNQKFVCTLTFLKDTPLLTWKEHRDEYLDACLVLNGRGRAFKSCTNLKCVSPASSTPTFRCQDCFGCGRYCKECIVSAHYLNPLHRIEVSLPEHEYFYNYYSLVVGMEKSFFQSYHSSRPGSPSPSRTYTRSNMPLPPARA